MGIDHRSATLQITMVDATDATFEADVIERSKTVPVVVDLWAEWCEPCKQLGPILEKVIAETDGEVELVKIDVDGNPGVSKAFKVQSIPAVYALKGGEVVDGFMGAQPEAQVREFVQRLTPTPEQSEVDRLLAAGDVASVRAALELEPDNLAALTALATLLVESGSTDEGLALIEGIPESADTRRLAAMARTGAPDDDIDATLAELLVSVKADEEARQRFIDLLEVLGAEDPRTADWRRKLSAALF